ncbi:sigma-54-dependent transcriptional regulator [Rhodocyclus tenuis]|uniref:DNA-binding NtrC family response regulator n=1 Tax=Rhodocyclus tenuis TaxID=1066 RepID=A0A840G258_RHOTE|nr:sigma-54 dependent transcriptional regulator [Rhodocyclus tenuis]MBB4246035.1 DNA-binding NtrC family response regulator [Rhodocyclus tenuis]
MSDAEYKARVLVVDDEAIARRNLAHVLEREGFTADCADCGEAALEQLAQARYDLVLTDLRMPGIDGMALLRETRRRSPDTEVIVITAHANAGSAVEAMKSGAFYYIEKPFRLPEVRKVVREAAEKVRLKRENVSLKVALEQAGERPQILTNAPAMRELLGVAAGVAPTDCNVLIVGPTGSGKELLARYVHQHSRRARGPFVAINCGALSEELLANELFGHERGAYTGAAGVKPGLIEVAAGGTLFLDEVTEMTPAMQVKLLRVLQEREFYRLGGTQPIAADLRFLAATNRDPGKRVAEGRFRQDLYFRLNVVTLQLPPLSERRGDIPLLALHFLARFAQRMGKAVAEIAPETFERLLAHDYPGNIRELENLIERGVALAPGGVLSADLLPAGVGRHAVGAGDTQPASSKLIAVAGTAGEASDAPRIASSGSTAGAGAHIAPLAEVERRHILDALSHAGGNRALAARLLGIDRVSLWRKLRRFEEDAPATSLPGAATDEALE